MLDLVCLSVWNQRLINVKQSCSKIAEPWWVFSDQITSITKTGLVRIAANNTLTFVCNLLFQRGILKSGFGCVFLLLFSYLRNICIPFQACHCVIYQGPCVACLSDFLFWECSGIWILLGNGPRGREKGRGEVEQDHNQRWWHVSGAYRGNQRSPGKKRLLWD